MTFADLNASFSDLRDGLRAQVGPEAIGDLHIRPPSSDSDEGSFLRLTAWCFALLFEAGRITVPFLLDLNRPGTDSTRHKETRVVVQRLRTALSHNLGFIDDHDLDIRRAVSGWFLDAAKVISPMSANEWHACFQKLCGDVRDLVLHCNLVLSTVATSIEDRDFIFDDLRRRLNRDWEPYQFDRLIEDSAARIGEKINARSFRDRRIGEWRKFLAALPEDVNPVIEMERLIDGEVAHHFQTQLPVRTQDLMEFLHLDPGPDVKRAIEIARRVFESGIHDRTELLAKVRAEFGAASPSSVMTT